MHSIMAKLIIIHSMKTRILHRPARLANAKAKSFGLLLCNLAKRTNRSSEARGLSVKMFKVQFYIGKSLSWFIDGFYILFFLSF